MASGRVFISYRRRDARGSVGRIYDRLADRFGDDYVFMDVDKIALGVDFAKVITEAVSSCAVLLAVIGPRWLDATDENQRRRLEDPDDLVRLEIATALKRDIIVIPVLVEDAAMPRQQELPEDLASLARRNALWVRHESFRSDTDQLLAAIEPILRPPTAPTPVGPGPSRAVVGVVDPADIDASPAAVQVLRHRTTVFGVAFSPDGRLLATASGKMARVWEVGSGQERARVRHDEMVDGVAFSPDGRLLATATPDDKTARVWDWASGQERARVRYNDFLEGVAFSPDGRPLATTSSNDGMVRVWEVGSGQERARVRYNDFLEGVAFSPDGRLLAAGIDDKTARVWDWAGGQERARVRHDNDDDEVLGVAFSPDGRLLATGSDDKTARVWALVR